MNTATAEQIRDVLVALATPDRSPEGLIEFAERRFGENPALERGIALAVATLREQAAHELAEADRLESNR